MKTLIPALLFMLPALSKGAPDLLPVHWFEDTAGSDGSIQRALVFRSVPGVIYTVESSFDLQSWQVGDEIYGLGHEHSTALVEIDPPPPPDPNAPPALAPASHFASLWLRRSNAPAGGTIISWTSLDDRRPLTYTIDGSLVSEWQANPLFARRFGDFDFFLGYPFSTAQPPPANPELGQLDTLIIATFEDHLDEMNQAVIAAAATPRIPPPPAPPAPDSRGFVRITADWSRDSDGDGSPDPVGFALLMSSSHPQSGMADPFAADVNQDGIPDGAQLDSDSDGIVDAYDLDISDPLIDWSKTDPVRLAVFPVSEGSSGLAPLHINAQGSVLFQNALWIDGEYHPLPMESSTAYAIQAIGMNDLGRIVGIGHRKFPEPPPGGPQPIVVSSAIVVWWNSRFDPGPVAVHDGSVYAEEIWSGAFSGSAAGDALANDFPYDSVLDNDGRFVANRPDPDFALPPSRGVWAPDGAIFGMDEGTGDGSLFVAGPGLSFGPAEQDTAIWQGGALWRTVEGSLNRIARLPGGRRAALRFSGSPLFMTGDPEWPTSAYFGRVPEDLNEIGFFPLSSESGFLYHKRDFPAVPWTAAAPGLPAGGQGNVRHIDGTPNGWVLSQSDAGFTASMPLTIAEQSVGSGVDAVSISSHEPGAASENRAWLMGAVGRNLMFSVNSGAGPNARVTVEAAGVGFTTQADFYTPSPPGSPAPGGALLLESATLPAVLLGDLIAAGTDGQTVYPSFTLGSSGSISRPIGVKIMKPRTVRVKIWVVPSKSSPTTSIVKETILGSDPAAIEGFRSEMENFLTSIFQPQINASFECTIERVDPVVFDSEDPDDFGGPPAGGAPPFEAGANYLNGFAEFGGEIPAATPAEDESVNINVYLVGGARGGRDVFWNESAGQFQFDGLEWSGKANREARKCWVIGGDASVPQFSPSLARIKTVMAHEIGHVLVGEGHPNAIGNAGDRGVAPLPGTNHRERLMVTGDLLAEDGSSRRLVKAEWDEAETWMIRVIDNPQP